MLAPEGNAGSSEAQDDVCRKYRLLLKQLTYNSKRRIGVLTTLAEESQRLTKDIVSLIEEQITKAPAAQKLPAMYLLDSIIKNVGGDYVPAFAKNLPLIFLCVFKQVDANTKKCLFQLRCTWNGIFPWMKLLVLDIKVSVLDPAWPIKPLPSNLDFSSILAKRKFPKKSECESTGESEISRRDPGLKRRLQEKSEDKKEEVEEKKNKGNIEKREEEQHEICERRPAGNGNEVIDGAPQKQDTATEDAENQGGKQGSLKSKSQTVTITMSTGEELVQKEMWEFVSQFITS